MHSRREMLLASSTVITTAIAGCGSGDGNSEASVLDLELETESDHLEDSTEIENGEYQTWTLTVPFATQFTCTVNVTSGPAVDLITMNQNEFNRYRDGEEFQYYKDLSRDSQKSIEVEGELASGEYRFIVDRTGTL